MLSQPVPLTDAADQIGLAYFNGAKMYFDAINAKNGVAGYKIEVKTLDDGYNATRAAANAKLLIDAGADALFGLCRYRQLRCGLRGHQILGHSLFCTICRL